MGGRISGRGTASAGAALAAWVCIVLWACTTARAGEADHLLLYPTTYPVDSWGAARKLVKFRDGSIEIWVKRSPGAEETGRVEGYCLDFSGNGGRAEYSATISAHLWSKQPVEVWAVNYPGYGGSTGPATFGAIPPSSLAAFDALRETVGDKPIFVMGRSLGSAAALYVATQRPVAGVVLWNPPPLRELLMVKHGWWNLWTIAGPVTMQIPVELDSIANARRVRAPALFLLAEKDEIVPPEYQDAIVDAYAGSKYIVDLMGAWHNSLPDESAARDVIDGLEWLWERAQQTERSSKPDSPAPEAGR